MAIVAIAWLFIYRTVGPMTVEQARQGTSRDLKYLESRYAGGGLDAVKSAISTLESRHARNDSVFLLADPEASLKLGGNIQSWPGSVERDGRWRLVRIKEPPGYQPAFIGARAVVLPDGKWLLAGRRVPDYEHFRTTMVLALVMTLAALALISLLGGHVLSRFILGRIQTIVGSAKETTLDGTVRRVPVPGTGDEFDELARFLNTMLGRMEELVATTRSATDSIAHDFRTPLTRLRTRLEMELGKAENTEQLRDTVVAALGEIDSVLHTLNSLLQIVRAEGNLSQEQTSNVDLDRMIQDLGELYRPLAEEKGLTLQINAAPSISIRGSGTLLAQAISNLLDNAIKFSPEGDTIEVTATLAGMEASVSIADHGPGIAPEKRELVLKRFIRLDEARSTPGAGLGLSLVAAVAKQHGATFLLEDNAPGLKASLHFPLPAKRSRRFLRAG